jgi:phospholipase/carboxylesterase
VVSYSGLLIAPERLALEIAARPPVLLVHGDADPVVPPAALRQAQATLAAVGTPVEAHLRSGLGHAIDEAGLRLGAAHLQKAFAAFGQAEGRHQDGA